jgi:hypothetical protein
VEAEPHLWRGTSEPWLDKLEYEYQNVRAAFHVFVDRGLMAGAWEIVACMTHYWMIRGGFSEGLEWFSAAGLEDFGEHDRPPYVDIPREVAGRAFLWAGFANLMLLQIDRGYRLLRRGEELLSGTSDQEGLAYALVIDACFAAQLRREEAHAKCAEAEALVRRLQSPGPLLMFLVWSYEYYSQRGEEAVVEANLREAARVAAELEYTYVLGSLQIVRYNRALLDPSLDYEELARESESVSRRFPEKGYMGLRASSMLALAFARVMQNRLGEAREPLRRALEFARMSGEMESQFYGTLAAAQFQGLSGNRDAGLRLLAAVDRFVAETGYPILGSAGRQYELARTAVNPTGADLSHEPAYLEGRKLPLEDAVVQAQHL